MKEFLLKDRNLFYKINDFIEGRPTIVFIHGMSGSSSAWIPYENKFENEYNILSFDLRGHGKSHRYKEYNDYIIEEFTKDFYDLVRYLDIKNFIMVSHSFGVFIALDFISKHKEYVTASIFLSPHFDIMQMFSAKVSKVIIKIATKIKFTISNKKIRKHIDYSKYLNSGDFNIKRTIADVSNTSLQVYLMCTKHSYSFNYENLLKKIDIPVLILSGEKDTIFPNKYARRMAKEIIDSEIITIKNSDHILVLNNFTEVSNAIDKFIKKINNTN